MNETYTESDAVVGSDSVSYDQCTIKADPSTFSSYSNLYSRYSCGSEILERIKVLHRYHNDSYQYKIYMEGVMDAINLMEGFRIVEEIDRADKYMFATTSSDETSIHCTQDPTPETSNENSEETEEDIDIVE